MTRLDILAIGRMRPGPERALFENYTQRIAAIAPQSGFALGASRDFPESGHRQATARQQEEGGRLRNAGSGSFLIGLDERGRALDSQEFARALQKIQSDGWQAAAFLIGGPDGHDPSLRKECKMLLSLGPMTWPHRLCRVMLAEQVYRAMTILSGHPYHRN